MSLEAIYNTQEEIPDAFRELYSERNGKWELTGITGIKTQADIDRVLDAKTNEANEHKKTRQELASLRASLGAWASLKPEEIQAKVDGYDALELTANSAGKSSMEDVEKQIQARLKIHTSPLERKIKEQEDQLSAATEEANTLKAADQRRRLYDELRKARISANVPEGVESDILMYADVFDEAEGGKFITRDNVGHTPGLTPDLWIQEMIPKREHWLPPSQGGGAKGARTSGATNGKTMKRAAFDALDPAARMSFVTSGGTLVD